MNAKFVRTISEQVIGLHEEVSIDPMSTATIDLDIAFPKEYSTLCIEWADCQRCSKNDVGCGAFIEDQNTSISNVSGLGVSFLSVMLTEIGAHDES